MTLVTEPSLGECSLNREMSMPHSESTNLLGDLIAFLSAQHWDNLLCMLIFFPPKDQINITAKGRKTIKENQELYKLVKWILEQYILSLFFKDYEYKPLKVLRNLHGISMYSVFVDYSGCILLSPGLCRCSYCLWIKQKYPGGSLLPLSSGYTSTCWDFSR